MPVESATYVNQLNPTNPSASDPIGQADDHLRLIKLALTATFPGLAGAVNCTVGELNQLHAGTRTLGLADGSGGAPSIYFDNEPGNGFYRPANGKLQATQRLLGNGTVPVGAVMMFALAPSGLGTSSGAGFLWLELNGALYNIADYPDLGAFYGTSFGGDGATTFGVPNMTDTNRYPRSRSGGLAAGTPQASQNKTHSHTVSITTDSQGAHTHTVTVTDPGHKHFIAADSDALTGSPGNATNSTQIFSRNSFATGTNGFNLSTTGTAATAGLTSSSTTGITASTDSQGAHTHSVSGTTATDGGSEARPESFAMVFAVKT